VLGCGPCRFMLIQQSHSVMQYTQPCEEAASLTEQNNRLTHSVSYRDSHFGLFWSLGLHLGYLATSGAKSDVIFLLGNPDFL